MKKSIVMSLLVLFMSVTSLFANTVNEKVLSSFKKEYANATEVSWQTTGQFLKVSFTLNEQVFNAYYNEDGERIAVVRNVRSFELPMSLMDELKKSYSNYWISDLFEFHGKEDAAYYVTVENADYTITLKSVGMSEWTTYKRTEKK